MTDKVFGNTLNQVEFAKSQGWSKSYVTQLKQAGRLVFDGKKVDAAASLVKIAETADANRLDVVERHQAEREAAKNDGDSANEGQDDARTTYSDAKALKEHYNALAAKLSYEREAGKVVEADDVRRVGASLGALLRSRFEGMPDQLAPELVPMDDAARIHAVLVEHIERVLVEISSELSSMVSAPAVEL
ncbi:MAG: hypothetical protein R8M45_08170 [Ghiorsea sp.]